MISAVSRLWRAISCINRMESNWIRWMYLYLRNAAECTHHSWALRAAIFVSLCCQWNVILECWSSGISTQGFGVFFPRKCGRVPDTLTHLEGKKHPVDPLPLFVCALCILSTEKIIRARCCIFCLLHLLPWPSLDNNTCGFKVGVRWAPSGNNARVQWLCVSEQNVKTPLLPYCIFSGWAWHCLLLLSFRCPSMFFSTLTQFLLFFCPCLHARFLCSKIFQSLWTLHNAIKPL